MSAKQTKELVDTIAAVGAPPGPDSGNGESPLLRIAMVALNENECRNIVALMTAGVKTVNDPRELAGAAQFSCGIAAKFGEAFAAATPAAKPPPPRK